MKVTFAALFTLFAAAMAAPSAENVGAADGLVEKRCLGAGGKCSSLASRWDFFEGVFPSQPLGIPLIALCCTAVNTNFNDCCTKMGYADRSKRAN